MPPRKVSLGAAFAGFREAWSPRVGGEVNGFQIKLVKLRGAFEWHSHAVEDELFLVHTGLLRMEFRDGAVDLTPGEFIIVPHGVEHRPSALGPECEVILFEPDTTVNTGEVESERTVRDLKRL